MAEQQTKRAVYDRVILVISIVYMLLVSAYMVWHQQFFSPDRFFVFAFLVMLLLGRAWTFFWDWLPPILLILGYDYLRGLVPNFITHAHIRVMIYFDRFVFGQVPTLILQHWFYVAGRIMWYDNLAVIMYFLHFVIPLLVALFFWFIDRKLFKQYMVAMVVLSYAAFVTYIIFPAAPPWMASQLGYLPPVAHIMDLVLAHFGHPINLPTVYQYVGANLVAAVPSLHAAYPTMTALFFFKKFPKRGWAFFIYPLAMYFAVMYLGEHYFFDITVAIIYCLVIYAGVVNFRGYTEKSWNYIKSLFRSNKIISGEAESASGGNKGEVYE